MVRIDLLDIETSPFLKLLKGVVNVTYIGEDSDTQMIIECKFKKDEASMAFEILEHDDECDHFIGMKSEIFDCFKAMIVAKIESFWSGMCLSKFDGSWFHTDGSDKMRSLSEIETKIKLMLK